MEDGEVARDDARAQNGSTDADPTPTGSTAEQGQEPTGGGPVWPRRPVWVWALLALVLAAIVGTAIGISLGSRQGGPLAAQPGNGGRPTIVVATSPAVSPSASIVPSPSARAAPSPAIPQAGSTTYVVQPGDTLRSIAQNQYGDATQWPRIYDANREVIGADPDSLNAGETLQIPPSQ